MASDRPQRMRAAPARLEDEQFTLAALAAVAAVERNPTASDELSSSESEDSEAEEGSAEEEERKESDRRPPAKHWDQRFTAHVQHPFAPPRGPSRLPAACDSPLDFFSLLLPDAFIQRMVDLTNAFGEQKDAAAERGEGKSEDEAQAGERAASQWMPTTKEELRALIGCLIYMGIVHMDATKDYWAALTSQSFVQAAFPRNRFLVLLRGLRVSEPESPEEAAADRLAKLKELLAVMEENMLKYFYPGRELTIDEAMIAFKGRSIMRQHIAKKASPHGFKVWTLVDCSTNYVCALDIFIGMKGREREEGATAKVVLTLLDRLQRGRYHLVGMDSYFSSVRLFETLLSRGFYAVGTTRNNRLHFPKELLGEVEGAERGEWAYRQLRGSPIVCVSWMDKKPVNILSSCTDPTKTCQVKRWREGEHKNIDCPEVLVQYMRYMRGVDVMSQRLSYSKIGRRSRKWFYSLVWFLMDVAIHNAYVLWQQKHNRRNKNEKDFREELMQQLVAGFSARKGNGKATAPQKRPRDSLHRLAHSSEARSCQECKRPLQHGQHNVRSHWLCEDCNVHLCVPKCYNKHIQSLAAEQAEEE
jgi:Transposase IS4